MLRGIKIVSSGNTDTSVEVNLPAGEINLGSQWTVCFRFRFTFKCLKTIIYTKCVLLLLLYWYVVYNWYIVVYVDYYQACQIEISLSCGWNLEQS